MITFDRKFIYQIYHDETFYYDLIAFIPLIVAFFGLERNTLTCVIYMLIFVKIVPIDKEYVHVLNSMDFHGKKAYLKQLVNLFLKVFIIVHFIACIWHFINIIELKPGF